MSRRTERWLLVLIVLVGAFLRVLPAVRAPLVHDENQWIAHVDRMSLTGDSINIPLHGQKHPPGQVYLAYPFTVIFGNNLIGYRAASIVAGVAMIVLGFVFVRQDFGPVAALCAASLIALNEYLIGVSRTCTEKNYLVFLLAALVLARRMEKAPSSRNMVLLGLALGAAVLTKESAFLWVPALGFVAGRALVGRPDARIACLAGAGAFLIVLAPWLYWLLVVPPDSTDISTLSLKYQVQQGLQIGSWSWTPLALYLRPLHYVIQADISEYPSLNVGTGLALLIGAIMSLFLMRDRWSRFLQMLGFGTFLLYSIFTVPNGEFWWADYTLLAFIPLTAALFARIPRSAALGTLLSMAMLAPALRVALDSVNYFPVGVLKPSPEVYERARATIEFDFLRYRTRNLTSVYRLGDLNLPAMSAYREMLHKYRSYLLNVESVGPTTRHVIEQILGSAHPAEELEWVEKELSRTSP